MTIIVNSLEFKQEMFDKFAVKARCIYNPFDRKYIKNKIISSKEKHFQTKKYT